MKVLNALKNLTLHDLWIVIPFVTIVTGLLKLSHGVHVWNDSTPVFGPVPANIFSGALVLCVCLVVCVAWPVIRPRPQAR